MENVPKILSDKFYAYTLQFTLKIGICLVNAFFTYKQDAL